MFQIRNWLFEDYRKLIQKAKKFLYIEHQYPFQNFGLTYYLCEALKANPNLRYIPTHHPLPSLCQILNRMETDIEETW